MLLPQMWFLAWVIGSQQRTQSVTTSIKLNVVTDWVNCGDPRVNKDLASNPTRVDCSIL